MTGRRHQARREAQALDRELGRPDRLERKQFVCAIRAQPLPCLGQGELAAGEEARDLIQHLRRGNLPRNQMKQCGKQRRQPVLRIARPLFQQLEAFRVRPEAGQDGGHGVVVPARHHRRTHRRDEQLLGVEQRRLLADRQSRNREVLLQRLFLEVAQQVCLARPEAALDDLRYAGDGSVLRKPGACRAQGRIELLRDRLRGRTHQAHGGTIGHARAQRLDRAPFLGHVSRTSWARGLSRWRARTSSQMRIFSAG
jgi:hypothetical protein